MGKFHTHFDVPPYLREVFKDAPPQLLDYAIRRRRTKIRYAMHPHENSMAYANDEPAIGVPRPISWEANAWPAHTDWNVGHVVRTAAPWLGQGVTQITAGGTDGRGLQLSDFDNRGFIYTGLSVQVDSVFEFPFVIDFACEIAVASDPTGTAYFVGMQNDDNQLWDVGGSPPYPSDFDSIITMNQFGVSHLDQTGAMVGFYIDHLKRIWAIAADHEAGAWFHNTGYTFTENQRHCFAFQYYLPGTSSQWIGDGGHPVQGSTVPVTPSRVAGLPDYFGLRFYLNGRLISSISEEITNVWYVSQAQKPCIGVARVTTSVPLLISHYAFSANHLAFV